MREFIRHPTDMPITYRMVDVVSDGQEYLRNISHGGLCFRSGRELPVGSKIFIQIPLTKPVFSAVGTVAWTARAEDHFEIGVQFDNPGTEFSLRMVEQICYIEDYKKHIFEKTGRQLNGEEAALEWISKYAAKFPT